jgi:undecaprenyl pyrophosphate synthase
MKIFYIPDGHRRYADRMGCSLGESYRIGYDVLHDQLIAPLLARPTVEALDVFLLSNLNLERRRSDDLRILVEQGEPLLHSLIDRCSRFTSVRTVGTYLARNLHLATVPGKMLTLVIGCTTDDDVGCGPVDIFLRTGGELRLSGAPRSIIGNYTQLYAMDELHPDLRIEHVDHCLDHYRARYMRETAAS